MEFTSLMTTQPSTSCAGVLAYSSNVLGPGTGTKGPTCVCGMIPNMAECGDRSVKVVYGGGGCGSGVV